MAVQKIADKILGTKGVKNGGVVVTAVDPQV
jgi:hypothetical protein